MAKKTIDVIIDGNTGKISIHVDGYETDLCSELARKLIGNNILIPASGDVSEPIRNNKKSFSKEKVKGKEELHHE